jgi:hypothetical protein
MIPTRLASALIVAATCVFAAETPAPAKAAVAEPDSRTVSVSAPVPRASEPADTMVVRLPGPPSRPAASQPLPPPRAAAPEVASIPNPPPAPAAAPTLPTKPPYPEELEKDSALYCQRRIGRWKEIEALALFGDPSRRRAASDDDGSDGSDGHIIAFPDPTGHYKELELDFDRSTGLLRTVFAYPRELSWTECRRTFGTQVTTTGANQGRAFHSYVNRRLDVLVDSTGRVISLGLY